MTKPFTFVSSGKDAARDTASLRNDSKKKVEFSVSKDALQELPPDYEETRLGDARGAKRQFRSLPASQSVHVREYDDRFTIHIDLVDPRVNPVGHLIKDSPETLASAAASLYLFAARGRHALMTNHRKADRPDTLTGTKKLGFNLFDPLGLFTLFLVLNGTLRLLKEILFG